jgi:uncharacterized protein YlxW (UPF0749 family)
VDNTDVTDEGHPDPHPFVSTSLFVDITTITVDPAYVTAAARRSERPGTRSPRPTSALALATLVTAGSVWGVAARDTRDRAPAAKRIHASLVEDALRRTAATDRLASQEATLRRETAAARDARLRQTESGRALSDELTRLELAVGASAVHGPGLVVTLDDGPEGDADGNGRIRDADLQAVVNALWAAGAEAVAVNDLRISGLTAIREAGDAILVDYRPVAPPYAVRAVGDPDVMEPAFGDGATARRFRTWVEAFGLRFDVARSKSLDLPAAETTRLRHATLVGAAS